MSRRKQARPRSCKRLDDSEEEEIENEMFQLKTEGDDTDIPSKDTVQEEDVTDNTIGGNGTETPPTTSAPNESGEMEFICETCQKVFTNLDQFMDHRNLECVSDEGRRWTANNGAEDHFTSAVSTEDDSSPESSASLLDEALSPDSSKLQPADIKGSIGVSETNPYGCQHCEKAFERLSHLKIHEQVHSDVLPFKCSYCSRLFRHKRSRDRHIKVHTGDKKYRCPQCDAAFARSDHLKGHMKTHENTKLFQCSVCSCTYPSASALITHLLTHTDSQGTSAGTPRDFICPLCESHFEAFPELQTHIAAEHATPCVDLKIEPKDDTPDGIGGQVFIAKVTGASSSSIVGNGDISMEQLFHRYYFSRCPVCYDSFTSAYALESHLKNAHEGLTYERFVEKIKSKVFECPVCLSSLKSASVLESHMQTQHDGLSYETYVQSMLRLFECPLCLTALPSAKDLELHLKLQHHGMTYEKIVQMQLQRYESISKSPDLMTMPGMSGMAASSATVGEMLVCPYCFCSDFDSLEILEIHMQSVHSVKPTEVYTCNYCNAPYQNLYSLHEHMRAVHQNQPSLDIKYPCSHCSRQFSSIENLQQHKRLIHSHRKDDREREQERSLSRDGQDHMGIAVSPIRFTTPSPFNGFCSPSVPKVSPRGDMKQLTMMLSGEKAPSYASGSKRKLSTGPMEPVASKVSLSSNFSPGRKTPLALSGSIMAMASHFHEQGQITCDHCNATFHDIKNYHAHVKHHIEGSTSSSSSSAMGGNSALRDTDHNTTMGGNSSIGGSSAMGGNSAVVCKMCNQQFSSEELLEKHSSCHYLSMTTEYGCTSCVKLFSKPDELQKHLMDIHAHHLYRCSLCKDVFDSKVNIQVHFAIKHSNECKLYKCTKCDAIFRSEMEWQVHVRVNHLQVAKPYRCLFCKESFSSEMDLQCHLTTHNKPFQCPMCSEAFHVEYLLDKHMQITHGSSGDKPDTVSSLVKVKVECDVDMPTFPERTTVPSPRFSPQGLTSPGIWKSSELLHTCNICDVKFEHQSSLLNHKANDHGLTAMQTSSSSLSSLSSSQQSPEGTKIKISTEKESSSPKHLTPLQEQLQRGITPSQSYQVVSPSAAMTTSSPSMPSVTMTLPVVVMSDKLNLACMYCSQTFKTKGDLEKHMRIHQNNGNQKCNICDRVYPSAHSLATHKLSHCKIVDGNTCVLCKAPINSEEHFYLHAQEHGVQGAVMQCVVCRQTLTSVMELQMHGKHHFQNPSSCFTCCVCLEVFESKENLVSRLNSGGRPFFICKPCYHGDKTCYPCPECGARYPTPELMEAHMGSHRKSYQCIKCQESFHTEYEIQMHVASHVMKEGNVHPCNLCSQTFHSPAKLQCHLIEHTYLGFKDGKMGEFRCHVCGSVLPTAADIQSHAIDHGPESRRYACSQCSQRFFFSAELENHAFTHKISKASEPKASDAHTSLPSTSRNPEQNEKSGSYDCSTCQKKFLSLNNLVNHQQVHEKKDKYFYCNCCADFFGDFEGLRRHWYACHHGGSGETNRKPFKCPECEHSVTSLDALEHHLKSHKIGAKLSCPICKKSFSSSKHLSSHLKSHDNEKPFECPICNKRFSRKENRKVHMKVHVHSPKHLNQCLICAKMFTSRTNLDEHMKIHYAQGYSEEQVKEIDKEVQSTNKISALSNGKPLDSSSQSECSRQTDTSVHENLGNDQNGDC